MEKEKENKDAMKEHIGRIVNPIFEKSASEISLNHTMVGKYGLKIKTTIPQSLYNPHNYRLYFNFIKENFNPHEGMVGVWFGKLKNYGSEFTATGEGVRITIKKTQVEIINKLSEEQWFLVNRAKGKEEIHAICNKIDEKCIISFKKFIEIYGGKSDFIILKREHRELYNNLHTKSDNKVMKEPFIDKLPLEMTFETDIVKKVYKKPNVEFKEPIYAANYLENSALNEFAPEIAQELATTREMVKESINLNSSTSRLLNESIRQEMRYQADLLEFKADVSVHNKVLKNIDVSFRKFNNLLSQKRLTQF